MSADVTQDDTELAAYAADEILALMGRRRINKAELCRRLGVDATWISRRVNGKQDFSLSDLHRIAVVLGVTASDLLPRNTVWKTSPALGERVIATVGEDRKPRVRAHRPGRPVRQTRPTGQTRPMTAVAAGR